MEPDRMPPPVDLERFRETMREAGVEEIVDPILEVYLEEAQAIFAGLRAAVLAGDAEAVRTNAHSLKSSSGNIWAARLAELLNELETAAHGGDLANTTGIFERVKPVYESVMAYLVESRAG